MSAELFIKFPSVDWYRDNKSTIKSKIETLNVFSRSMGDEFWLKDPKNAQAEGAWEFDIRIFTSNPEHALLEISAMSDPIEKSLHDFLSWLRSQTDISIVDEDGEISGW